MASQPDQHLRLIQVPRIAWIWSKRCVPLQNLAPPPASSFPFIRFEDAVVPDAAITTSVTARLGNTSFAFPKIRKLRAPRNGEA